MRARLLVVLSSIASLAAIALGTAPQAAASYSVFGPDVSSFQHPNGAGINWGSVYKAGARFAIVKATEDVYYTNPYFKADYCGIHGAHLVRGAYEFARPALPMSTATAQADYFVQAIASSYTQCTNFGTPLQQQGDLAPILDLEVTGGLSPAQLIDWAQTWVDEVHRQTGRMPIVYSYPYFWWNDMANTTALNFVPLWIADYNGASSPAAGMFGSWPTWSLWQYTDSATISGISGQVDLSYFNGSLTGLNNLANPTLPNGWPAQPPTAPVGLAAGGRSGSATVSWLPSFNGGSDVTSYRAVASPGGAAVSVSGSASSATFSGLNPATAYTFTVTATNADGTSSSSLASNPVTPSYPTVFTGMSMSPSWVTYGGVATMSATLVRTDTGAGLAGQSVQVYTSPHSAGHWTLATTLTTSSSGSVAYRFTPSANTDVGFTFTKPGYSGAGGNRTEWVVPAITQVFAPNPAVVHKSVTLSGTVRPLLAGQTLYRQVWTGSSWSTAQSTTVTSAGTYSFTMTPGVARTVTMRVYSPAVGSSYGGTATQPISITVVSG